MTKCYQNTIRFSSVQRRKVEAEFSGGAITGNGNGIWISGKGFWSLRMSRNRLIYGNIFVLLGFFKKTLTFQHGLWQSTLS